MAAAASPLSQIDGFYDAKKGAILKFSLSSSHGYLTIWTVTYGGTSVPLSPASPTINPAFSITVAPGTYGPSQALHVTYNPLAGGPGQEDVVTLSLTTAVGNSVIWTQTVPDDGTDFSLSIAAV